MGEMAPVQQAAVCIVGAGPAGLQLGRFLQHDSAGLGDYVIFERAAFAGSFFARFPVHRLLISLNKRHTRLRSAEFRMRHDWNSLLDESARGPARGVTPVTARSEELYPHADVVADYLREFAVGQESHIRYGAEVLEVAAAAPGPGFAVSVRQGGDLQRWQCRRLVLATGLQRPHIPPDVVGAGDITGYEELPASGRGFSNRSVLVWGFGNAAHETARELSKHTQAVTLLHRTKPPGQGEDFGELPRLALFTHYPGDIRTVTMQIYDSYLLKALDVKLPYSSWAEPIFLKCLGDMVCVWIQSSERCGGAGEERWVLPGLLARADGPRRCALDLGPFDPEHSYAREVMGELRDLVARGLAREGQEFFWRERGSERESPRVLRAVQQRGFETVDEYLRHRAAVDGVVNDAFAAKGALLRLDSLFLSSEAARPLLDAVARWRPVLETDPLRHPFHNAVRCLGWRSDLGLLDSNLRRQVALLGKYPVAKANYEAPGVPGLYFAGALAHGRDHRRSAGGFIHGFRYTARALYRGMLREEGLGWPNASFALDQRRGCLRAMQQVWRRVNEAAGPYQMFGELADAVVFSWKKDGLKAEYLEELPEAQLHGDYADWPRLSLKFVWGKRFGPMDLPSPGSFGPEFAELSKFLHPRLEFFAPGAARPQMLHALVEDVYTEYAALLGHIDPLLRFLAAAFEKAAGLLGHDAPEAISAALARAPREPWRVPEDAQLGQTFTA